MSYDFRLPSSYWDPPEQPDEVEIARSTRTARVPHVCGSCGKEIKPGDRYDRFVLTSPDYPGQIRVEKVHPGYSCYMMEEPDEPAY